MVVDWGMLQQIMYCLSRIFRLNMDVWPTNSV